MVKLEYSRPACHINCLLLFSVIFDRCALNRSSFSGQRDVGESRKRQHILCAAEVTILALKITSTTTVEKLLDVAYTETRMNRGHLT
ncbi:unnamed protein product [Peronospora belbahrii]|uniref:Uncharacterized protein n=1 Tax=Peronospora belbahrii TaxID=622444 RepID=A0ABN8CRN9_9STRA|nr:unnamed protein product [Peronospora belbahrii]